MAKRYEQSLAMLAIDEVAEGWAWNTAQTHTYRPTLHERGVADDYREARLTAVRSLLSMLHLGVDITEGWVVLAGSGKPVKSPGEPGKEFVRLFTTEEEALAYIDKLPRNYKKAHQAVPIKRKV